VSFLFNFLNATIWECTPFDVDCGGMREQLVEDGAKTSLQTLMEDKCCPFRKDLSGESECLGIRRFWETISSRSAPRSRPFRIMFMTPNCRTVRGNLAAVNDTNYQHLLLGGLEEDSDSARACKIGCHRQTRVALRKQMAISQSWYSVRESLAQMKRLATDYRWQGSRRFPPVGFRLVR
jgi:hypothetical protein